MNHQRRKINGALAAALFAPWAAWSQAFPTHPLRMRSDTFPPRPEEALRKKDQSDDEEAVGDHVGPVRGDEKGPEQLTAGAEPASSRGRGSAPARPSALSYSFRLFSTTAP